MKKILIVEDEKILAEMYQDRFSQEGFQVVLASTSEEGIDLAKKENPDLILLDILLPKENGISFLRKLKQEPEISSITVIAFSNYDEPKTRKEAESLGVKAYLLKTDFTPQALVKKITEYLS
ncbi:MAG TPA: response regulator [Candidatus Nealsonbacteria bacterium]|uniref:Response regulatory domain-containing protein n=1 Tax=marine sediment metagenome TaxID=412755 RepID=A0A0F9UJP6_9ZZZZ|nr:response regulator [Candidatus Nealsonbacteria bacterium]HEB46445.1 response regulator [Candidatus Nealsonbacteria bacterium]